MNKGLKIILASGSPRRKKLLEQIGIEPVICPSGVDEDTDVTSPRALVEELSCRKCLDIAEKTEDGIIVGADTVVAIDDEILGKPKDAEDAKHMLERIQGKTHHVYTGVTIARREAGRLADKVTFSEKTEVHVAGMTDGEIDDYIATGEPLDKAGAYGAQGGFAKFIEGFNGDYCNVVGLPVAALYKNLKKITG